MKPEVIFREGGTDRPLVIFIHGMGMDANFWTDPLSARVLGGKYPLSILLGGMEPRNSFHDLNSHGFPVLTWSQQRPAGEAAYAFDELHEIVETYPETAAGLVLIGHSRGGLLARKLSDENKFNIKLVITLAAPHQGSTVARWASLISPAAAGVRMILDAGRRNETRSALQRIAAFLSGKGLKEMLPDSDLLRSLSHSPSPGIKSISIGGTDPDLVRINNKPLRAILSGIVPEKILPVELQEGLGDGFVSASSSVWPGCDEHRDFRAHHAGLIFHPKVREYIKTTVNVCMGK